MCSSANRKPTEANTEQSCNTHTHCFVGRKFYFPSSICVFYHHPLYYLPLTPPTPPTMTHTRKEIKNRLLNITHTTRRERILEWEREEINVILFDFRHEQFWTEALFQSESFFLFGAQKMNRMHFSRLNSVFFSSLYGFCSSMYDTLTFAVPLRSNLGYTRSEILFLCSVRIVWHRKMKPEYTLKNTQTERKERSARTMLRT